MASSTIICLTGMPGMSALVYTMPTQANGVMFLFINEVAPWWALSPYCGWLFRHSGNYHYDGTDLIFTGPRHEFDAMCFKLRFG